MQCWGFRLIKEEGVSFWGGVYVVGEIGGCETVDGTLVGRSI